MEQLLCFYEVRLSLHNKDRLAAIKESLFNLSSYLNFKEKQPLNFDKTVQ
jgi:hypothetical protein